MADIRFYFDPVCPFAWMTSKWVRLVAEQRAFDVEWRFISLRLLNAKVDYAAQFPPHYPAVHGSGLRLLRVAARVRAEHGTEAVGRFYAALGAAIHEADPTPATLEAHHARATPEFVEPVLAEVGLPTGLSAALDDDGLDAELAASTEEAIGLTGRDVGTPIIHFQPPDGVAFFGPVISRLPDPADAVALWDHVVGLAAFPGFAELKRSLRERVQLRGEGWTGDDATGAEEDWHGGSRRQHR